MHRQTAHRTILAAFGLLAGAALVIGGSLVLFRGYTAVYVAWAGFSWTLFRGPLSARRLAAPAIALGSLLLLAPTPWVSQ